jgi:hypothetical protein
MSIDVNSRYLGSIARIRSGYPFRGAFEEVSARGVLVAQMKDIDVREGVRWSGVARAELPGRQPSAYLESGDVLFVTRGGRYFAACISQPPEPAVCGQHLLHLRTYAESGLLPAFLAWQLNQAPLQRRLHAAAEGSNQLGIRIRVIEALSVAVPPLHVQQRIIDFASAASRERDLFELLINNRELQMAALAGSLAQAAGINATNEPLAT